MSRAVADAASWSARRSRPGQGQVSMMTARGDTTVWSSVVAPELSGGLAQGVAAALADWWHRCGSAEANRIEDGDRELADQLRSSRRSAGILRKRRRFPDNLWVRSVRPRADRWSTTSDLEANQFIGPGHCDYHMRVSAAEARLKACCSTKASSRGSRFPPTQGRPPEVPRRASRYSDRLQANARAKTGNGRRRPGRRAGTLNALPVRRRCDLQDFGFHRRIPRNGRRGRRGP